MRIDTEAQRHREKLTINLSVPLCLCVVCALRNSPSDSIVSSAAHSPGSTSRLQTGSTSRWSSDLRIASGRIRAADTDDPAREPGDEPRKLPSTQQRSGKMPAVLEERQVVSGAQIVLPWWGTAVPSDESTDRIHAGVQVTGVSLAISKCPCK